MKEDEWAIDEELEVSSSPCGLWFDKLVPRMWPGRRSRISDLYSLILSFFPSTRQVRFGRGRYLTGAKYQVRTKAYKKTRNEWING